jgi:3-deoxy-manno-octulosonate cytidylyltransferase (CMP-KDO synthetase)
VPARLNSSRFKEKVLAYLAGKPILQWIFEAASNCPQFDDIIFAVDHERTYDLVTHFGGKAIMTDPYLENGTRRIISLLDTLDGDIFVNWQGDEPFIDHKIIDDLLQFDDHDDADVWTLKKKITEEEERNDTSVVKVVTDKEGRALYFSRHAIPFGSDEFFKHAGIYAYTRQALEAIEKNAPTHLERVERLEQLGFLYHGLKMRVFETAHETLAIDLPIHLEKAAALKG